MPSALKEVLQKYTLSYKAESADSVEADPVTGETYPTVSTETMVCSFAPSKNDALIFQAGADVEQVAGMLTCLDPVRFPDSLNNGSELDMTFNGVEGKVKLMQIIVDDLPIAETVLGQVAKVIWRPLN